MSLIELAYQAIGDTDSDAVVTIERGVDRGDFLVIAKTFHGDAIGVAPGIDAAAAKATEELRRMRQRDRS